MLKSLEKLVWFCKDEEEFNKLVNKATKHGLLLEPWRVDEARMGLEAMGRETTVRGW